MYWRVRKLSPDQMVRQYGVHVGLVVSVLVNLLLIATRPQVPKVSAEAKQGIEQFARTVTQQLLDTSYISFKTSTMALLEGELDPHVVNNLRAQEMIAKTQDELNATAKELTDHRQVSACKIDEVIMGELNNKGLQPVEVKGVVAIHSAEETGPSGPVPFDFKFLIGAKAGPDGQPLMASDGKSTIPMVAEFQDASPKPQ